MGDTPDGPSTGTRWPVAIHWFLPTGGDSREVVPADPSASRAPDHSYLAQVATACDHLGFDAVLTPCGTGCDRAAADGLRQRPSRCVVGGGFDGGDQAPTTRRIACGKSIP